MQRIGTDIWILKKRLSALGVNLGRVVTVMRSPDGDLAIHSTGEFTGDEVAEVRALGNPRWLFDAMADHDTFIKDGCASFPECIYLGPPGIVSDYPGVASQLYPAPKEWDGWIEVLPIDGVPSFQEHVCFHPASRTLVLCDLVINVVSRKSLWESLALRMGTRGGIGPGISRRLQMAIKDKDSLKKSLTRMMEWDFERVVVGHRDPILQDGKAQLDQLFRNVGWL